MSGNFYIVATPIGNLKDITLRALEVLKSVDYIACEDTRVTKALAAKYEISAKLFDCHKFNEKERSGKILELLSNGSDVALVSDAGTPGISDPGGVLIKELQKNGIKITSIPGACAVSVFLSRIPRDTEEYAFIGFIPRTKKQQTEILNKYKYTNCVFYDSPNRLIETLQNISDIFGKNTKIAIGRELTKIYEEIKTGSTEEILEYYKENPLKGEITAMVFAHAPKDIEENNIIEKINILKSDGYSQKDIIKIISKLFAINKNKVYDIVLRTGL